MRFLALFRSSFASRRSDFVFVCFAYCAFRAKFERAQFTVSRIVFSEAEFADRVVSADFFCVIVLLTHEALSNSAVLVEEFAVFYDVFFDYFLVYKTIRRFDNDYFYNKKEITFAFHLCLLKLSCLNYF